MALAIRCAQLIGFLGFHLRKLAAQFLEDAHGNVVHLVGVDVVGRKPFVRKRQARVCARSRGIRHVWHVRLSVGSGVEALVPRGFPQGLVSGRNFSDEDNMQNQRDAVNS